MYNYHLINVSDSFDSLVYKDMDNNIQRQENNTLIARTKNIYYPILILATVGWASSILVFIVAACCSLSALWRGVGAFKPVSRL